MANVKYVDAIFNTLRLHINDVIEYSKTVDASTLQNIYDILCCYTAFPTGQAPSGSPYKVPVYYGLDFLPLKQLEDLIPIKHLRKTSYYDKYKHKDFYLKESPLKRFFEHFMFLDEDIEKLETTTTPFKNFLNLIPVEYVTKYVPYSNENRIDLKPILDILLEIKAQIEQLMKEQNIEIKFRYPYIDTKTGIKLMAETFGKKPNNM